MADKLFLYPRHHNSDRTEESFCKIESTSVGIRLLYKQKQLLKFLWTPLGHGTSPWYHQQASGKVARYYHKTCISVISSVCKYIYDDKASRCIVHRILCHRHGSEIDYQARTQLSPSSRPDRYFEELLAIPMSVL
mmetsp:Transcript_6187/g.8640  ORF Transcript_6187/g.8640 Transcript_6187/m.8640 type:complete len:135 (-) Transcript_6187:1491-1895(-)